MSEQISLIYATDENSNNTVQFSPRSIAELGYRSNGLYSEQTTSTLSLLSDPKFSTYSNRDVFCFMMKI